MADSTQVDVWAHWRRQQRTSKKTGKVTRSNFRIDIEFKPKDALIVNTDAREANKVFGNVLLELIGAQLAASRKQVSPSTQLRRERAERAPGNLSRWYKRRYAGGRTESRPPNSGPPRKFGFDSGRLIASMRVGLRQRSTGEASATINVASNRLDPRSFGSAAAFGKWVREFRDEVPALKGGTGDSTQEQTVIEAALAQLLENYVSHSEAERRKLKRQAALSTLRIIKRIHRIASGGTT